jgi:hypothetical protein
MLLFEHVALYCLESLAANPPSSSRSPADGAPPSREVPSQGRAWLLAQGVTRPLALAQLLAPGCRPPD